MSAFYDGLAITAISLIGDKGRAITLRRANVGVYDPAASATVPTTTTDLATTGAVLDYPAKEVDGVQVFRGDKKVLLSPTHEPTVRDALIVGSDNLAILDVRVLAPDGTPVLYVVQARKGG